MKYLELRLMCNHITELMVILKDEIVALRSKPNQTFDGETFIKTLIIMKRGELIISTTKEYAEAMHQFIKDETQDILSVEGDVSTSY